MLREQVKKIITEKILRKNNTDPCLGHRKFGVLVLDKVTVEVINAAVSMGEVFHEGVTLVEEIARNREPLPALPAIYILSPTVESIDGLIADFTPKSRFGPKSMYREAFVYFIDPLSDANVAKIAKSRAFPYIKTLWEMNLSFTPIEEQVFTVVPADINETALSIASVCSVLNIWPNLRRYHSDFSRSAEICYGVERQLGELLKNQPELVIDSDAQLIILDRSFDLISPLLHECSLQAMAADLINYKKGVYTFTTENGQIKEVILDESDKNWVELRHKHIGEAMARVNELTRETLKAAGKPDGAESLAELSARIKQFPAFQKKAGRLNAYITMADELRKLYFESLEKIVLLEQDMATGYTTDAVKMKDTSTVARLSPLILPGIPMDTRIRLLLIFMLSVGKDKDESYFATLLSHTDIPNGEKIILMKMLRWKTQSNMAHPRPMYEGERFQSSRWDPRIKEVLLHAANRTMNKDEYPVVGIKTPTVTQRPASSARYGRGLSGLPIEKRKIILFIVGGMTYSEIRTAYEISATTNTTVFIGSDSILTPATFVDSLRGPR